MSVVEQRDIPNSNSSAAVRNMAPAIDDRVKVNRFDIYHENRNELNAWLIQMKIYFEFNDISKKKEFCLRSHTCENVHSIECSLN